MDIVNQTQEPPKAEIQELKHPDTLVEIKPDPENAPLLPAGSVQSSDIKVEENHKNDFLECLATGERYTEDFSLFNGKINVKIRCRSIEESDALMAYLRSESLRGNLDTDYEYQALTRIILLVAQVAQLNDISFPEMEKPLFSTMEGMTKKPPAWVERIAFWRSKPEALVSAISACVSQFETRYWSMIKASSDINFWQPGQSTGQ